ncbi:hypothetical protein NIES267_73670 (plasmid) [Calothrix parasitica NIES-267]|uniref:Uncharacterized protein n=1 Tax=Calothrix parasitica NIES-267 TaxID=1973488 RepID=A0A1Z4M2X3_9CYAN|nr:hypothetical protein NIES267_73670 [Calothrix parasitica NIES-267]
MELFTKKNMIIGGVIVLVAIPTALIGIPKAQERIEYYNYAQAKQPGIELGKTEEKLKENIHLALKNKNRENAYAMHCMDGGNTKSMRERKDQTFSEFWEQVLQEDYSESTIRLQTYEIQTSEIFVENIKADGQTFSREFLLGGRGGNSENSHKCASFIPFYNYENKTYFSDEN